MVSSFLPSGGRPCQRLTIITVEPGDKAGARHSTVIRGAPFLAGKGHEDDPSGQGIMAQGQAAGNFMTIAVPEALSSAPLWMSLERKASEPDSRPPRPRWS